MRPPTALDRLAGNRFGHARHRAAGGGKHHAVFADKGHGLVEGHERLLTKQAGCATSFATNFQFSTLACKLRPDPLAFPAPPNAALSERRPLFSCVLQPLR